LPDYLDSARKAVEEQLKSLRGEVQRLEAAASALAGGVTRRGPGRPRGSGRKAASATKARPATRRTRAKRGGAKPGARRQRRGGTRAAQALALVKGQPGITIPELATKMGIKQNYLYRVMPSLQKDRKVAKRGRGWHAV
jgi:hypothetical protein